MYEIFLFLNKPKPETKNIPELKEFQPSETFSGRIEGYVFKKDIKGTVSGVNEADEKSYEKFIRQARERRRRRKKGGMRRGRSLSGCRRNNYAGE